MIVNDITMKFLVVTPPSIYQFATSYTWKSFAIKYGKLYLWQNLYAKPFTKVLVLVGFQLTSNILGIVPSKRYWKD